MRAFIFILGIIGIPFFQEALSQVQWQRLNNQKTFIPEDVLVSPSGDKFISIYGRKTILYKKSGEDQWVDILANNPELSYFFFNDTKKLFLDFRGAPLLYYRNSFLEGIFANSNDEFALDTSTLNNIYVRFSNDLHFDTLGNYFQFENNKLIKYNNKLEDPKLIFNKQETILKIAMFQEDVNYVLTQHHEDSLYYYLLNSANSKTQLLSQLDVPKNFQSLTAIGRSGNLFIVKADGLYRLDRLSLELNKLILDPALQTTYSVSALYVTKADQFIVKAENYFYFSDDDGNTWTQLASFAQGFPDLSNIRQIEISDSSNALAILEDECSNMTLELSEDKWGWYLTETDYSSVHRGSLLVNSKGKIYAQRADCYLEESKDNAFTWQTTQIEGKDLYKIYKHGPDDLFAITAGQKQLFHSFDGGDQWSEITEIHNSFPDLVFLDFKNLAIGVSLLLGVYIDPLSGQIERYLPFIKMGTSDWIGLDKAQSVFFKHDVKFDKKNKLIYSLKDPFVHPEFYVSDDFGSHFIYPNSLNVFSRIYSYGVNEDGFLFVNGIHNGMLDFYVSRDQQRFSPVENGRFKDAIFNEFFSFPNNIVVAISVLSNIYISDNGGETWEDFSNGLGLLQNDVKNVGDFTLDDASNAYASISFDGLYKSINPLVTTREFSQDNGVNLYYDKSGEQLKWHCQNCTSDTFREITLFDIMGRVVKQSKINAGMTSISIPNEWTFAPYAYSIKGKGNFQAAGYFVKY